jgi:hypothetical protein
MNCSTCDRPAPEPVALRDDENELGPFCVRCALDELADKAGVEDVGFVRVEPWHCPCWDWVQRGSQAIARSDNPPAWVADEQLWVRAREAVRPRWEDYRHPWGVVVQVYKSLGGRIA